MKIKISRNGKIIGEFSPAALRIKLRDRAVLPTDKYWFEGMSGWEPVSGRKNWVDFDSLPATASAIQPQPTTNQPSGQPQSTVKGVVLDYNLSSASGVISTEVGLRYAFLGSDWKSSQKKPGVGLKVEFVVSGANAIEIYTLQNSVPKPVPVFRPAISIPPRSRKSRGIYVLLAFFVGCFGVHSFYAGYTSKGKWMLIVGLIGIFTIVPLVFTAIVSLVDIFTVTKDAHGVPFD